MIGKTIYHTAIVDEKVVISSCKVVGVGRKYLDLDRKFRGSKQELKDDVGVVIFLTKQEAMNYFIGELKNSVECGETYLAKTRRSLINALEFMAKHPF